MAKRTPRSTEAAETVVADDVTAPFPDERSPDAAETADVEPDPVVDEQLVGPEPEHLPPPAGFGDPRPDIVVFPVVDDDDAERRRAIAEWKLITPRTERVRQLRDHA